MGQFPKLGWGRHSWGHDPQVWVKFPMEPCPWILFFWGGGVNDPVSQTRSGSRPLGSRPTTVRGCSFEARAHVLVRRMGQFPKLGRGRDPWGHDPHVPSSHSKDPRLN